MEDSFAPIEWEKSYEQALERARVEKKEALVYFTKPS